MAAQDLKWMSLPAEIRQMVLNKLCDDTFDIARYAIVCREWQQIITRHILKNFRVTSSRLDRLQKIEGFQRAMVKRIEFRIILQEYECWQCQVEPSSEWHTRDRRLVETAIRDLFAILSTWSSGGLILDISIFSPSDAKHHYQDILFDKARKSDLPLNDEHHGWLGGRRVSLPDPETLIRIFSEYELPEAFWDDLPQIMAVTELHLRRQSRRRWSTISLAKLLACLPMLKTIYYEPWREWIRGIQEDLDEEYLWFFHAHNFSSLEKLVIFEEFNDVYPQINQCADDPIFSGEPLRTANAALSGELARLSLSLQAFSTSFMVDAEFFFASCHSTWTWHRLTSLALTSRVLSPENVGCSSLTTMLQAAAAAALKMPRLNIMALWNYTGESFCAFIYQASVVDSWAKISWRATWDLILASDVVLPWEAVAQSHTSSKLSIRKEMIATDTILKAHGDAIERLNIPCDILHSESLQQIQQETLL